MEDEELDRAFSRGTIFPVEGGRAGLTTCEICGAAILIDSRDDTDRMEQHARWHRQEQSDG